MDITTIIYIVVALIVGATTAYLFMRKRGKSEAKGFAELSAENESLKLKLSAAEEDVKKISSESSQKVDETKEKYETLLKESNTQCEKSNEMKLKYESLLKETKVQCEEMDKQLKNAMEGKIDECVKEKLQESEKLKKKIKDLEEEIEDNEDDLKSLKNKIRDKDSAIETLQDDLDKEKKSSKSLQDELSSVKQSLEEKVEELDLKMGSLTFIQEILSAKESNTEDVKKMNKNIDKFESFVKGYFMDLNSYLYEAYKDYITWNDLEGKKAIADKKQYFNDSFEQWASTKRKSWLDKKTTIAFVGEFSAGKTSIVNRILSQDDPNVPKLPVSAKATTAIPTYIAGGSTVSYSFISGDAKRKEILEKTFKKVSKEVLDQVKGISSLIKYFVMTYKNPNLEGLSILDTPGFNSNDSEDKERTIDVINECDALFWVFDVNAGTVNRSSISIIKEKLNKPLYVVINKVDTKADTEIKKVENLIKQTLTESGIQVQQFIRFSGKNPLTDIMNPIHSVSRATIRDTFVQDVEEDIQQLLGIFTDMTKSRKEEYDEAEQRGAEIIEQFQNCVQVLQNNCEDAYGIPHFETHFFGSDRFEMSQEEGNHFKDLLAEIYNENAPTLSTKFEECKNTTEEILGKWRDYYYCDQARKKISDCLNQYKKVIKNIA